MGIGIVRIGLLSVVLLIATGSVGAGKQASAQSRSERSPRTDFVKALEMYADAYVRQLGRYPSRKIANSAHDWPTDVHTFVRPYRSILPIFSRPSLGSDRPTIVGLTQKNEYLRYVGYEEVMLINNPISRRLSSNGMWYKVQLLNGRQGYLLGRPRDNPALAVVHMRRLSETLVPKARAQGRGTLAEPRIGKKSFYLVTSSDLNHEYCFTDGIYLEVADGGVIDCGGNVVALSALLLPPNVRIRWKTVTIRWDYANNVPAQAIMATADSAFTIYFNKVNLAFYQRPYLAVLLVILLGAYALLVGVDLYSMGKACFALLLVMLCVYIGYNFGQALIEYSLVRHRYNARLLGYELPSGQYLPMPAPIFRGAPEIPLWYSFLLLFYVPLFALAHIAVPVVLPFALRGAHYLFVQHPMEKHIPKRRSQKVRVEDVLKNIPEYGTRSRTPRWVLRNRARRLDRIKKNLEKQNEVIEKLIQRERNRAGLDDYKKL